MASNSVDLSVYNFFQAIGITMGIVMFLQLLKGMGGMDIQAMLMGYLADVGKRLVQKSFEALVGLI